MRQYLDESRIGRIGGRARRREGRLLTACEGDTTDDEDGCDKRENFCHSSLSIRLIRAIVDGLATGEFVARKTPSAQA